MSQYDILEERYISKNIDRQRFPVSAQHYNFAIRTFTKVVQKYNPDKFKAKNEDAFDTAKLLARKEGISVGISSGAALYGSIQLAKNPDNKGKVIVALLLDSGDRYYSTPLFTD